MDQRRAARRNTNIERRTVDANFCNRRSGANRCDRCDDRRYSNFGNLDVNLRNVNATDDDRDGMSTRIARAGLHGRVVLACALVVVIRIR